jgi:predicted ABC-type transport system involved in lysophospholipase L1 biosynthesis ATPase subunit
MMNFAIIGQAAWIQIPNFTFPAFNDPNAWAAITGIALIAIATIPESTAHLYQMSLYIDQLAKDLGHAPKEIKKLIGLNLVSDGADDIVVGMLGGCAGTNYGENNSLMAITRCYSVPVLMTAGVIAILSDVSLTLEAGSPSIIVGPNGAGKSVLLRLLHGLLAPSTGRVLWAGDAARRQAMVFQRPVLLRRSVLANAVYPLKLAGVVAAEREPRARAALEMVGLAALADRPARRLSGGEQQRLALARAAALSPEVLFLDEKGAQKTPDWLLPGCLLNEGIFGISLGGLTVPGAMAAF